MSFCHSSPLVRVAHALSISARHDTTLPQSIEGERNLRAAHEKARRQARKTENLGSESVFSAALPDVDGGTIYALAIEPHIPQDQEKPSTWMGVLVALRHP